ncbi:DNA topoisomerase 1 [Caerostris extrusa]|uniref:DNA topoisomerase 1 n=1 Tax=Caerostris extrusa TaxID=172846 RepID=A0AAV4SB29_CAEEX|nr:DNA topoisomerase 1 [Caerostris extrusa]
MFANRLNIGAFDIGNCVQVFKMEQTDAARKVNKVQIAAKRKKEPEAEPSRREPAEPSRREPEAGPSKKVLKYFCSNNETWKPQYLLLPTGHMWKEVRHDNTVCWLAKWTENIFSSTKYIKLNPSSKTKGLHNGEKDCQKFETARKLRAHVDRIRDEYTQDFKSDDMPVRQRAVALYFIDQLALRAGNEKDEDTADTVGCCSLRVEHISLDEEKDGKRWVVNFNFLGKDSIRYVNSVTVVKEVFNNLRFFMEKKKPGIDFFDKLTV